MTRIEVHEEVTNGFAGEWSLYFQYCTYHYADGSAEDGYRFIWKRPDGSLQPARGQARIPDAATLQDLISAAQRAGWFR